VLPCRRHRVLGGELLVERDVGGQAGPGEDPSKRSCDRRAFSGTRPARRPRTRRPRRSPSPCRSLRGRGPGRRRRWQRRRGRCRWDRRRSSGRASLDPPWASSVRYGAAGRRSPPPPGAAEGRGWGDGGGGPSCPRAWPPCRAPAGCPRRG
jgi:hypothetical protein